EPEQCDLGEKEYHEGDRNRNVKHSVDQHAVIRCRLAEDLSLQLLIAIVYANQTHDQEYKQHKGIDLVRLLPGLFFAPDYCHIFTRLGNLKGYQKTKCQNRYDE